MEEECYFYIQAKSDVFDTNSFRQDKSQRDKIFKIKKQTCIHHHNRRRRYCRLPYVGRHCVSSQIAHGWPHTSVHRILDLLCQ